MFLQKNARIARINGFFTNPVYLSLVVQLIRGNVSILFLLKNDDFKFEI